MPYLIDTSTLIDFSKGITSVVHALTKLLKEGEEVGVCPINITEFYSGISPKEYDVWDDFFEPLTYWEISRSAAKKAGEYRYEFARKGKKLSTADTLIAAVARQYHATIITTDIKDYPMKDIRLLSLRQ